MDKKIVKSIPAGCSVWSVRIFAGMTEWHFVSNDASYSITTESDVIIEHAGKVVETVESAYSPRICAGVEVLVKTVTGMSLEADKTIIVSLADDWRLTFLADNEDEYGRLFIWKIT